MASDGEDARVWRQRLEGRIREAEDRWEAGVREVDRRVEERVKEAEERGRRELREAIVRIEGRLGKLERS